MPPKNQMALDFPHYADYSAANFLEMKGNVDAFVAIKQFPQKEGEVLVIYGPKGCGKTHLLNIWNDRKGDMVIDGDKLDEVPFNLRKVAIDDLQNANKKQQENLFYLFNHIVSTGGSLLVSSDTPVAQMDLMPEIQSRLLTAPQIEIKQPEEQGLQMLLVKWAHERQLHLEPAVLSFLLSRADRNIADLHDMVAKLDELSLEQKRKITIPLIKEALGV